MWKLIILTMALAGCSVKSPTSAIVDEGVQLVDETIEYADKNIDDTADTVMLKNGLKTCRASLISCGVACDAEKESLNAKVSYWRLACSALAGVIAMLVYLLFRKK